MASLRARIINQFLPLVGLKHFCDDPDKVPEKIAKLRRKGPDLPSKKFRRKYNVMQSDRDGYPVFTVTPRTQTDAVNHILYLHGGGYILDIDWAHWDFIGRLIDATGVSVTVPLYPLAPEHKCEDVVAKMCALFEVCADTYGAQNVIAMGDSAGAGLSLALAHMQRDQKRPGPGRLVLLSPWLDATASDPAQLEFAKHDKMLALNGLHCFAELYAGSLAASDPRVSPLFGSHENLPPIQVFTGTWDLLCPDARRFRDAMASNGTPVDYHEYAKMFHVWMLLRLPESKQVMRQIASFLQAHSHTPLSQT